MTQINKQDIIREFPNVFGESSLDANNESAKFHFDVPDEWLSDMYVLFKKIDEMVQAHDLSEFKVIRVIEKFGTLRVYVQNSNEQIDNLIRFAEYTIGE